MDATVCPNCKLSITSNVEGASTIYTRTLFRQTLETLIPDLHNLVERLPASDFQAHLDEIISVTIEDLDNEIAQKVVTKLQELQLLEYSQPTEIVRTLVFELFLELAKLAPNRDNLLDRPVLKALGIDATLIAKELERRAMQSELSGLQYLPLPALAIENEKELLRKVLIYLATLEALSGSNWKEFFRRSLKDGEISEEEINAELTRWHKLFQQDLQPIRPDSPWRETLKRFGHQGLPPADERSFVSSALCAENSKCHSIAEDIARASLRLLQSSSDVGSASGINQCAERLKVLARGVISSCCDQKGAEYSQIEAQSAFYDSVKQMIIDTFIPKELHSDPALVASLKQMNSALDIAVADNLSKQTDKRQEAALKYNRAIFAAKEAIDEVRKKGYKATPQDTARAKVERLLMIKSLAKLAEIKYQEDELGFSEQYLLSAARHLDEFDRYQRENCFDAMHAPLRPVIHGSLGLLYLQKNQLGRACRALKRAKQALATTKPIQMLGFMITYQGVIDEYDQLKSRLA